jgi:hypothetical protein
MGYKINIMVNNFEYKVLAISLSIIIVIISIVAWSPKSYAPMLVATSTLDFANTSAGTATDLTVSVTGAVDGDPVIIGIPNGSTVANGHFVGWVSSGGVVTIRFLNNNLITALNPASGTFKIVVLKK